MARMGPATKIVRLGEGTDMLQDGQIVWKMKHDFEDSGDGLVALIDFGTVAPTTRVLREFFVPFREATNAHANVSYVLSSSDPATREVLSWMADANDLGMYITSSPEFLRDAEPAGDISAAEAETLEQLKRLGGTLTAAELAEWMGLEATAAGNRLVNLARKGYVLRIQRPRRQGDQFIDPRTVSPHTQLFA